jgi:hypothetical protein
MTEVPSKTPVFIELTDTNDSEDRIVLNIEHIIAFAPSTNGGKRTSVTVTGNRTYEVRESAEKIKQLLEQLNAAGFRVQIGRVSE